MIMFPSFRFPLIVCVFLIPAPPAFVLQVFPVPVEVVGVRRILLTATGALPQTVHRPASDVALIGFPLLGEQALDACTLEAGAIAVEVSGGRQLLFRT
jgi:hypothetical protein